MYEPMTPDLVAKFWSLVDRCSADDCWEWMGVRDGYGYGQFSSNYHTKVTHRIAYELTHGPIPVGMLGCHRCNNPPCCNPSHIYAGTHHDNAMDAVKIGKWSKVKEKTHALTFSLNDDEYYTLSRLAEERVTTKQSVFRAWLKSIKMDDCQEIVIRKEESND